MVQRRPTAPNGRARCFTGRHGPSRPSSPSPLLAAARERRGRGAAVVGSAERVLAVAVRRQARRGGRPRTAARSRPGAGAGRSRHRPTRPAARGWRCASRARSTVRPRAQRPELRHAARSPTASTAWSGSTPAGAGPGRISLRARFGNSQGDVRPAPDHLDLRRHRLPAVAGRPERLAGRMDRQGLPRAPHRARGVQVAGPVPASLHAAGPRPGERRRRRARRSGVSFVAWERGGIVEARVKLSSRRRWSGVQRLGPAPAVRDDVPRASGRAGAHTSPGWRRAPSPPWCGSRCCRPRARASAGADDRHDRARGAGGPALASASFRSRTGTRCWHGRTGTARAGGCGLP